MTNNNRIPFFNKQGVFQQTACLDGYSIEISTTHQIDSFKEDWLKLEQKKPTPFFLTWHWISCWIKTYQPDIISVTAKHEEKIVAIGLFTLSLESRHRCIHSLQLRLHQMGNILMDQIWMEYNDFITEDAHQTKAVNACLKALDSDEFIWDEVVLSMMSYSRANQVSDQLKTAEVDNHRPAYAVNLSKINLDSQNYLNQLTANTRYQIRRSIRQYEKDHGKVSLQQAKNTDEAMNYFIEAGQYHKLRWDDSGYKNEQFILFHQNLIRDSFGDDTIHLLKLTAGKETIAIMYYHLVDKTVFFYLHGLKYENNKKLKPGLVAHALATEFYLQKGMKVYDYMGGYSQYKAQLAKRTEDLATVIIQRPRSRFKLEKVARKMKSWIIQSAN
jgi:CelD/BcsL family acetyltransferase involved in cellulose biosynthesis